MNRTTSSLLFGLLILFTGFAFAADKDKDDDKPDNPFGGLELRGIGPAFMSGRIADIAINPQNESQWYVAVGSGSLWKTDNAGNT